MARRAEVDQRIVTVLAGHGLAPGPAGWDLDALEHFADGRGWRVAVEPVAGALPGRLVQKALVWDRTGPADLHATRSARGRGRTEGEALAEALASALTRWVAVPAASGPDPRRVAAHA